MYLHVRAQNVNKILDDKRRRVDFILAIESGKNPEKMGSKSRTFCELHRKLDIFSSSSFDVGSSIQ